jgi:hypothetical protein
VCKEMESWTGMIFLQVLGLGTQGSIYLVHDTIEDSED